MVALIILLRLETCKLDTSNHQILAKGELLSLSARESAVLEVLMMQKGKVITKDKIAQHLSLHGDALADNAIEVYIHCIRKRIEPFNVDIRTLRGLGYLLEKKLEQ